MRASGILLPVSSLPSAYGIGCFSKSAYAWIDLLVEAGQTFWQILPMGPTGYGDSPYQSFSTFAGNPYFISLEDLIEEGLLTKSDCENVDFGKDDRYVSYDCLYKERIGVLRKAFEKSDVESDNDFKKFIQTHGSWLGDYALFMAIKDYYHGQPWNQWPDEIKMHQEEALRQFQMMLADEILFQEYMQYVFMKQWMKLKRYANEKGIKIIGDIPIYVAYDSADVWASSELFWLDTDKNPVAIAGCPPDGFSADGQLWGNPLYDWTYHKKTEYSWWIHRIAHCKTLYDIVRIDHFRGFDEYYVIPYGSVDAKGGRWMKGPGMDLFKTIKEYVPGVEIIAEDLGYVTASVKQLVKDSGFPGMKLLEFAFDSRESGDYLPHHYDANCVVYTGTHDNETLMSWYDSIDENDRKQMLDYIGMEYLSKEEVCWMVIRLAMQSVAKYCIIPIQDYLLYGDEARMNHPSTQGNNWRWRLKKGDISLELVKKIGEMTKIYDRC